MFLPLETLLPLGIGVAVCGSLLAIWCARWSRQDAEPVLEMQPLVTEKPSDNRQFNRREGNPVEVLLTFPDKKGTPRRGYICDRSQAGLGIMAYEPFEEGARVLVRPAQGNDHAPWIEIEVRSCRQISDGYELGCRFLRTPPWAVLLSFN